MGKLLSQKYQGAALITGASGGLGAEFARQIAAGGMNLILVARSRDKMETLATELRERHGVQVQVIAQDLSALDAAQKIQSAVASMGWNVGLLVNNAGFGSHGRFQNLDVNGELRMVDLNCRTPVALTAAFIPQMIERRNGGVIFLASIGAYQPTPFFATYGATKAFNLMLGEALWAELRDYNVDVIALSPGYTRTEFQQVAGVQNKPVTGWSDPRDVVERCLNKLGRKPSTIPGFMNWLLAWSIRFTPRRMAARAAYMLSKVD